MDSSIMRVSIFLSVFALMAALELWLPARKAPLPRFQRWRANLGILVIGALAARVVLPATLVGVALWAEESGVGVLHWLGAPVVVSVILSILLLDLAIYWQHRLFHRVPILWRLHKVHHADSHVDSTTGLRFHPVEIVLSLFIKGGVILLVGAPALAVIIFEVALNAFSLFNHTNIRLPLKWDDRLAYLVITQRLHRIHHSQHARETNTNFGFSVSWWDRLFNSYRPRARQSDEELDIGLREFPATSSNARLSRLLTMPFTRS
ncbi:sterol desaturase family protein [Alteromonas ponticola]|uniref:Sterol desaturase family protein n=1 Tax=Alteromonas ponticola TaxID=2720613 RepID=A0ABX1R3P2_9ALTE|nr:sterol desaturase family protein [Alteromonas ponticola]NMH59878.1 sterol desaturase family protein [Alteromonas ponticola]